MPCRHALVSLVTCGLLLATGCAVITDPMGRSVAPAMDARQTALRTVVPIGVEQAYRKVLIIGDAAGWEVFREFPEKHVVVYHKVPGSVDSTQVGVFCVETEGGTLVEIASPSAFSRELAAKTLFRRL